MISKKHKGIKICGIKSKEDIRIINQFKPTFIGFIFYKKSKRYIDFCKAQELIEQLNYDTQTVGVFVNEKIDTIINCINITNIDIIQLHGDEGVSYVKELKTKTNKRITKAFRVDKKIENIQDYDVDYYLFDSFSKLEYGGSGTTFNWGLIESLHIDKPYFLAGGINTKNVKDALHTSCHYLDISSGVEIKGNKNSDLIKKIMMEIARYNDGK